MLEIFLLVSMCRYCHRVAKAKGYPGWAFAVAMGVSWFVLGIGGAILGAVTAIGGADDLWMGWVIGYFCGVACACGLNALAVNLLAAQPNSDDVAQVRAELSERDYIAWRKGQLPKAKRVDDGAEVETAVVELSPADATPPPAARRVWERKYGGE